MNRFTLLASFVVLLSTLVPTQGLSTDIVGYITLQNSNNENYNGILGIKLYATTPQTRYGDIMVLDHPDIPYYIAHFPDFSYIATAN